MAILTLYELTCNKCGGEFLTAIPVLLKREGRGTCANCGEAGYYVPSDLKGFSSAPSRAIGGVGQQAKTGMLGVGTRFRSIARQSQRKRSPTPAECQ